ncbi:MULTISPECIES: hypothetical protein [Mycobacterium]|uniref:hypothetical protein n=1 Tax=Mycobacterium TaxID=1763 RepID=UPI001EE1D8EF|nr:MULTISPECIES: hypothetical protein [Mycobacterium]
MLLHPGPGLWPINSVAFGQPRRITVIGLSLPGRALGLTPDSAEDKTTQMLSRAQALEN